MSEVTLYSCNARVVLAAERHRSAPSAAGRLAAERWERFFCFTTLEPRVEWIQKSMNLRYEPSSEPLHISAQ